MPVNDLSAPAEKNPLERDHAYPRYVFASDRTQYSEDIWLPHKAGSTAFETVARPLIHRHVMTGLAKQHCREESTKGSSSYADLERLHRSPPPARRLNPAIRNAICMTLL